MDIDILKAKRKSLRAAFTVCCNGISNRIETEILGNNEVNALYKQLLDKFSRLETTQEEISDLILISDELKNTYPQRIFRKPKNIVTNFVKFVHF
ncbi:putative RNA-directed DNA polymerase from transposon X-element [Trichonephila inaurata madagascariensis]|uniref:Putative RNA-directed DNA polymerase from transposon X-element n=1 Tax=Trichonephila inaurata madagascariensis TaxID=2747483 RepID=A0A8X7CE04_9ARAC|nr:putative RNA-directed DNA polymerase from transposon X-element [Trichonephila inaurata madagascariensis]